MNSQSMARVAGAVAAVLWLAGGYGAEAKTRAAGAHPDFSGVWQLPEDQIRTIDPNVKTLEDEKPPYNAVWMKEFQTIRARSRAGMKIWDPASHCLPPGMPRTMNANYPFELLMTKGRVTMLTEFFNETRRIWTDGRKHPAPDDLEPTFVGHSIGHWEGDTLVIDTIGLRHETLMDISRAPHSDQMRIVERVRRTRNDQLEWTMTLIDPVVFDKPWTVVKHFIRSAPGTEVREYVCSDGNQVDPYVPSPEDAKYDKPDPRLKTQP